MEEGRLSGVEVEVNVVEKVINGGVCVVGRYRFLVFILMTLDTKQRNLYPPITHTLLLMAFSTTFVWTRVM